MRKSLIRILFDRYINFINNNSHFCLFIRCANTALVFPYDDDTARAPCLDSQTKNIYCIIHVCAASQKHTSFIYIVHIRSIKYIIQKSTRFQWCSTACLPFLKGFKSINVYHYLCTRALQTLRSVASRRRHTVTLFIIYTCTFCYSI